ncbi:MAG: tryptophan 7-halogenase, partial [Verrucomicrobiota bacterium]
ETVVGVKAKDRDGNALTFNAPITIDATGRTGLSMNRHGWRVRDKVLNKIAIWTYFKGAKRDPGKDEGATTVAYVEEKNWFWYIPLKDDRVSVGIVGEKDYLYKDARDPKEIFHREVEKNAWIKDHLEPGESEGEYRVTGEFSYRSEYCSIDGLVMAGDAFAFLDPVFSSGVMLALKSGQLAAEAIDRALDDNDVSAARFADYGKTMCSGIEAMRRLVYTFYDDQFSFKDVLMKSPDLKSDMTDCLIGHVDRDYDEMFEAVSEFARLPEPLPHGKPREPVLENSSGHAGNG